MIRLLLVVFMTLLGMSASADNDLTIEPVVGKVGKTVNVPVCITNDDDVIAAQFDVTLPFRMASDGIIRLTNRMTGHSVSTKNNGKTLTVVLSSMDNKPLRGNSGTVLYIPMDTSDEGKDSYDIAISNIVLTDKYGNNIATHKQSDSKFIVSRDELPDVTVENVKAGDNIVPGTLVNISYDVKNVGDAGLKSGFSAKIYLESPSTGVRTYLGTKATQTDIEAGAMLSLNAALPVPQAVHIDGKVRACVEIVPNADSGELKVDQLNNSAYSEVVNLSKQLFLTSDGTSVREGSSSGYVTFTLTRSGDWSVAETYKVVASVNGLFSTGTSNNNVLPATIVIPAETSSATFRVYSVNDDIVRAREADIIVEAAHGYEQMAITLQRIDDDKNPLSVNLSKAAITEGQQVTLKVTRGGELTDELDIPIYCSTATRFAEIPVLHFASGQSEVSTVLTSVDDIDPQVDCQVKFSVVAKDYRQAETYLSLNDNDRPALSLEISPSVINESAGNNATTATLRREGDLSQNISVKISSNRDEAFIGSTVVQIPAGESSVEIPVGVKDNTMVDGARQCELSAAMYVKADMVYASSDDRAYAKASFTITDDESPYLSLWSKVTNVSEGSNVTLTLKRVVPANTGDMVVTLKSNDSGLEVPKTVTIPSGASSVNFTVRVLKNGITDDDRFATITADAASLMTGVIKLHITDRTLPDATILSVGHEGELYSGCPALFKVEVHNDGTDVLPKGTTIDFYMASSNALSRYTDNRLFFSTATDKDIEPGETKVFSWNATIPEIAGQWWLNATINADGKVAEFSTTNNRSSVFEPMFINAPFSLAEITTDKQDYLPGEYVNVTGRVEGRLNGQTVRVGLDGSGQHTYSDVKINDDGSFVAYVLVDRSAAGKMIVKALALGQTEAAKTVDVNVYNLSISTENTLLQCDETYIKKGTIRIYNTSDKAVTGIKLEHTTLPYGCALSFGSAPSSIAAHGYADIAYTVNPTIAMTTAHYEKFTVTASCDEGVSVSLPFSYMCRAINANISASSNPINTTLLLESSRVIEVNVTNYGLKETGAITMLAPKDIAWISSLAPATLPSLQPGQSATLRFQLNHQKGMHSGQAYSAHFTLNPENGAACGLNFNITVTGTEYSKLNVKANDVYSLANKDFSKINGATVTVANNKDGRTILTGELNAEGTWTTASITQGTYDVTITAPRHNSVRKTLTIGPGEESNMSFTLPYQAVMTKFISSQDPETNMITLDSHIDIDKSAPQAIVIPEFPEICFKQKGEYNVDIVLKNIGLRPAINPSLSFPTNIENVSFTVNNGYPSILNPGESYVLNVTCNISELGKYAVISSHKMRYDFAVSGNSLSETDIYQRVTGEAEKVMIPEPEDSGDSEGSVGSEDSGDSALELILPSSGGSATLEFEDLSNVRIGQPVHAVLTVRNDSNSPMNNIRIISFAEDVENEEDLSEYVQAKFTDLTGFSMSGTSLTLDGGKEGKAMLEFEFNEEIAEKGERTIILCNQISHVWGGITSSSLFPGNEFVITPEDKVRLVYLLQKNILADDNSTEDVVESVKPAEAVMLVHNEGNSVIGNVRITNEGLSVVADDNLHTVSYQGLYSALGEQPKAFDISKVDIDSICRHEVKNVHVIYKASEMAHVENAESIVESTMVEVDGQILTNIKHESVKELIRSVRSVHDLPLDTSDVSESDIDYMVAALAQGDHYLLNLAEDEYSSPDAVLDGRSLETYSIKDVSKSVNIDGNAGNYVLTVSADKGGWIYGKLHDPTNGKMVITSIVRQSDKVNVSAANFWQTDRTVLVDYSVINENLLHFADSISGATETYVLTYELQNDEVASVLSVSLYNEDNELVENGNTTKSPVVRARVDFTRPIKKFIHQSISFTARDENIDFGDNIKDVDDSHSVWDIVFEGIEPIPGKHEFAIDASLLKDKATKKSCNGSVVIQWNEDTDVTKHIDVVVSPSEECGKTDLVSGDYKFGPLEITATPEPGYEFSYWSENGRRISENSTLEYNVEKASALQAVFVPRSFVVRIEQPEHGKILGSNAGIYDSRFELRWIAVPDSGYIFDKWIISEMSNYAASMQKNNVADNSPVMDFTIIDSDVTVTSRFSISPEVNFVAIDNSGSETVRILKSDDSIELTDGDYKSVCVTEDVEGVDISYTRSFGSTDWQALYVPFALVVDTDLDGFDVYEFSSASEDVIYVSKVEESVTEPNTPYFIRAKETTGPKTFALAGTALAATQEKKLETAYFDVIGTYTKLEYGDVDSDWYALKNGKFLRAGEGAVLTPFRFYLRMKGAASVKDCINIIFEGITAISTFSDGKDTDDSLVNIAGQAVGAGYKGIVIRNGKKIFEK